MTPKRIFLTGSSGCVGHYLAEALIQETPHELFLLVRTPDKLKVDCTVRPGIHLLQGDLRHIQQFADLLKTIEVAVLAATTWGGPQEVYDINVIKTQQLIGLLNPQVCEQIIYFSTASILDRNNQLLKQAGEIGTDYIRSKYVCYQQLSKLELADRLTTVFPTLVFGGDGRKPYSHLSAGLPDVTRWIGLARFLSAEGSFHFIHAYDIAQVVSYLVDHPAQDHRPRKLVLGNPLITVDRAVEEICAYFNQRIYFRIPVTRWLMELLIVVFRIQVSAWDRFFLDYRHDTHQDPVTPSTLGRTTRYPTLAHLLKERGLQPDNTIAKLRSSQS
ncbi:MAG: NAD(P)-dependent oxidoreductase [Scytolyngbya sp. HA4215-MV1]|jgi:nucleoside-diphosphate-sugar epimerase|nr:NAD(P)-dependent oxidoreductase [Scytolyngbya sp. HA4215-MV1]